MTGPETAERNTNRDILMMQIRNPATRETLKRDIPNDARIDYSGGGSRGSEIQSNLAEIARVEKGNAYKYILGITTVAQTPDQLANAFGALRALSDWQSSGKDRIGAIETAQKEFLSTPTPPMTVSPDAKSLQTEMKTIWDRSAGDVRFALRTINSILMSKSGDAMKLMESHFAEAYLASILDSSLPLEMRQALLNAGNAFNLGLPPYLSPHERRFDSDASFWKSAKPAWLFPEVFGRGTSAEDALDPKDAEIIRLKRQIEDLRRRPSSDAAQTARISFLERENLDLKTRRDRQTQESAELTRVNGELRIRVAELEKIRGAAPSPDVQRRLSELTYEVEQLKEQNRTLTRRNKEHYEARIREKEAREAAEREAARARAERKSGGPTPFEVLGITDRVAWDAADKVEKRKLLNAASRVLRMKYHTDQHVEAAKDPVAKELLDKELVKINLAVEAIERMSGLRAP